MITTICPCETCEMECTHKAPEMTREEQLLIMATWVAGMIRKEEDRLLQRQHIAMPNLLLRCKLRQIADALAQIPS